MCNSLRISFLVIVLLMLAIAGCSRGRDENPIETGDKSSEITETSQTDNDASVLDSIPPKEEDSEAIENMSLSSEDVEKAIDAYASVIKDKAEDSFLGFTLIHLDDGDSPELAMAYGGAHASGVGFYGFDETGVNEICTVGSFGMAYYEKGSGIVYGWYTGQGETHYNIGIIKDGKLKEMMMPVIAIQYGENYEEILGYEYFLRENWEDIKPKSISKEEFKDILAPYAPEIRQYRELEYSKLHDVHKTTDIKQALRDSLAEEDSLPKPDIEFYHVNTITGE